METQSAAARLADQMTRERSRMPPLLEAMRPKQWSKNVFVLAGIVFAGRLFDLNAVVRVLSTFALFCAAASAVYLANDVADKDSDAHHPIKRLRPIASGRLAPGTARAVSIALALIALVGAFLLNRPTLAILAAYLVSSFAYSFGLKRVFLLDTMIVALGFVLRAAAGASSISAVISPWLLVCSFLLALYLALGKRRAELVLLGDTAADHRASLGHYSLPLVDSWLTALSAAAIVSYAIYTQSERTVEHFGTTNLLYTIPFVIYALFRYQHHVMRLDAGGDPGSLLVSDKGLWIAILGWGITAAIVIYR
jgi:4-hydroxybenzoate polyprenyltransferase